MWTWVGITLWLPLVGWFSTQLIKRSFLISAVRYKVPTIAGAAVEFWRQLEHVSAGVWIVLCVCLWKLCNSYSMLMNWERLAMPVCLYAEIVVTTQASSCVKWSSHSFHEPLFCLDFFSGFVHFHRGNLLICSPSCSRCSSSLPASVWLM